mmetsp:Transcript_102685/g.320000  ORF Transcript_102685/g.320000 Transcript_102685/m.320000 type:complete len:278 (-) Transcript_102685:322-1155(-)
MGCMRYCTFSMCGTTWRETNRSKRLTAKPDSSASRLTMVGGSCLWSPTRTATLRLPRARGMMVTGSVACAASSMTRLAKVLLSSTPLEAPLQVQHTTCDILRIWLSARHISSPEDPDGKFWRAFTSSTCSSSSGRIASGRPTRTARRPSSMQVLRMLSTAMLLSAQARTGVRPCSTQRRISFPAVWVFPVPGGPWISVRRLVTAAWMAPFWDSFKPSQADERKAWGVILQTCSAQSLASKKGSAPKVELNMPRRICRKPPRPSLGPHRLFSASIVRP